MRSKAQAPLGVGVEPAPEQAVQQCDEDRHHSHAEHDFWELAFVRRLGDVGADALGRDELGIKLVAAKSSDPPRPPAPEERGG